MDKCPTDGGRAGRFFLLARAGQPVCLGHGDEGVRVGVGEPQREYPQLVDLGGDAADSRLVLGILPTGRVAGDHAQQRGALCGVQSRRGAAARGRHARGEPRQEIADSFVADRHLSSPLRRPAYELPRHVGRRGAGAKLARREYGLPPADRRLRGKRNRYCCSPPPMPRCQRKIPGSWCTNTRRPCAGWKWAPAFGGHGCTFGVPALESESAGPGADPDAARGGSRHPGVDWSHAHRW